MRCTPLPAPPVLDDGVVRLRLREGSDVASIAAASTDVALGLVNVQLRSDALATVAYAVFPTARGRGIAGRALALATRWALGELGLTEVRLEIDPGNLASLRVAEKAGWSLLPCETTAKGELVLARRRHVDGGSAMIDP